MIVSFVGSSGAGKTTVIERLIPLIRAARLRVGTVKHASHGYDVDKVGSDSWRHRQAGAEAVLLAGADGAVLFLASDAVPSPNTLRGHVDDESPAVDRLAALVGVHLADFDVVLAEGFAPLHDLLIEVRRKDVAAKVPSGTRRVWLTITDEPAGRHEYHFHDLAAVAARIVDSVRGDGSDPAAG